MGEPFEDLQRAQVAAAKRRFAEHAKDRKQHAAALEHPGGLTEANPPGELTQRLGRIMPGLAPSEEARAGEVLEAIIDTSDFVGMRYLEDGVKSSRAVCRVDVNDPGGGLRGYGTGSMVSPRLLLTNHHVLPTADVARTSRVEFNFEDGIYGGTPKVVGLDPGACFLNDEERDFALVAVAARPEELAPFGLNRLIEAQGKAVIGDFVTIVQHPRGEMKRVALRDNRILDQLEYFLHYEADTEPGSSGSPVFNDQWEIVALHHASVATPERGAGTYLNEGVRASRILRFVAEHDHRLAAELRAPERIEVGASGPAVAPPSPSQAQPQTTTFTVPLQISVSVGAPTAAPPDAATPRVVTEELAEPFHDEDYTDRPGYDTKFLGVVVPLPKLKNDSLASRMDDGSIVLPYEHFSIVMNKVRRMAFFTASNVDASPKRKEPEAGRDYTRKGLTGLDGEVEKWFIDPRIPALHQLPDRFFTKDRQAFDKGHIVRREDAAWGDTYDELRKANGDTFHVTNCSPQVATFNRSNKQGIWGLLENLVLKQAATERYCIFAGPVFRDDDRLFAGFDDAGAVKVGIPKQFWKLIVAHDGNKLQAFAFVLDQDLSDVDFEFSVDAEWRTHMRSVPDLEKLLGTLTFPKKVRDADQIDTAAGKEIMDRAGSGAPA